MITYDADQNLAEDYLSGASNFVLAAERIFLNSDRDTAEWKFKLESPFIFLLGHGSELILKCGLAKMKLLTKDTKHSHNLIFLLDKSQASGIPLNDDFVQNVSVINENFFNHDHRYQRVFAGFPEDKHDEIMEKISANPQDVRKELREFGLVVRNTPNIGNFLKACQGQIISTAEWI